ncbi:TonB-dependent receptor domain-containing protein [uncultured Desulfobacter sp.]|uniref:TonB-dependent receptor n=1 Tax=uncultured Desulfobacter sp. TaxID=240139 RepID=UPI0029C60FFC|nr:TonB-dependent receptor [uncultured Desulfobacter sp.]
MSIKKRRISKFEATLVLLLIGLFCGSVLPPGSASEDNPVSEGKILETITVTAQKRKEDVQKVPNSITVLSDVTIEDASLESTKDVWRYVPNMATTPTGARSHWSRIKMRGISNAAFGDPAVALYIDDVSYAGLYAFNSPLFDIERIEVLKGPQGTLYGKNTEGGAINIITKSPGNKFEAKVGGEIGDYDKRCINASVSAPLVENKFSFRLSALKSVRDGYIENLFNGEDIDNQETTAANARLLFTPSNNLSFDLKFRTSDLDDDGGAPYVPFDKNQYQSATGLTGLDDFQVSTNYEGESTSKSNATSLRVEYEWDRFDLISVTAYRDMDNENSLDADLSASALYISINTIESESFSQEFRLQSKDSDESFKWLLGLYYGDKNEDCGYIYNMDQAYADMMGVPLYTQMDAASGTMGAEDMAAFGQSTLRFFNNALGLTAGLRFEQSKRTLEDRQHTTYGSTTIVTDNLERTESELLPKLALDYRINKNLMTYSCVAKGYKAGGYSYAVDDPGLAAFDPEVSTAFELGLKTEFPEQKLRVNLAGFYTKVDDYQDRVMLDMSTVVQANVTETDIYGFELEASYVLSPTLTLNGFIGYTNAEYGDYIDPMTQVNYRGNRAAFIPEYDAGLFLEYRNRFGLFARAEMQYIGSTYFDRANAQEQGSYALYHMKLGYEQEKWDIYLSAKNLTDEPYVVDAFDSGSTVGWVASMGDPRTISLIFNYRF